MHSMVGVDRPIENGVRVAYMNQKLLRKMWCINNCFIFRELIPGCNVTFVVVPGSIDPTVATVILFKICCC